MGMNETKSLNLKTISLFLIDWLPDNILELPEEARLLRLLYVTLKLSEKWRAKLSLFLFTTTGRVKLHCELKKKKKACNSSNITNAYLYEH